MLSRWFIADPIPFTKSIRFDLELWHWEDVEATFDRTTYWYGNLRHAAPKPFNLSYMPLTIFGPMPGVEGAIEGEMLKILEHKGGKLEKQGGFSQTSGFQQLWWREAQPGDKIVLEFPVAEAGRYDVIGHFAHNVDYGIHTIRINGKLAGDFDFYSADLKWDKRSLGMFDLPVGTSKFEAVCKGSRLAAKPGNMLGIDYLKLTKQPSDMPK